MLTLALLATLLGLGLLAVSTPRHWRQLRPNTSCPPVVVLSMRIAGVATLALSLALCLRRDHPSMAALVWIMLLAVDAAVVAMWLSGKPVPDRA